MFIYTLTDLNFVIFFLQFFSLNVKIPSHFIDIDKKRTIIKEEVLFIQHKLQENGFPFIINTKLIIA